MNLTTRTFSIEKRRRCTMICVTILLCYLFTCCTHLTQLTLAASNNSSNNSNSRLQQGTLNPRLDTLGATLNLQPQSVVHNPAANGNEEGNGSRSEKTREAEEKEQQQRQGFSAANKQQLADDGVPKFGDWRDKIKFEDLKHDNVHKLMSEQDLRRTFQVDSHDQVPEYEILKLTVNPDGSHLISPISDLGELTTTKTTNPITPTTTSTPTTTPTTMKVSIFGKVFHLRLKRNADFQQRIKDMKMFMAESTGDGQLRYTEIKNHHHHSNSNNQQQQHHHKQEPHKRAAVDSTSATSDAEAENAANVGLSSPSVSSPSSEDSNKINNWPSSSTPPSATGKAKETLADQKKKLEEATKQRDHISSSSAANVWNIGSTYHDEDNLAALLIDHDRETGQLKVDGTIGNDFVIKPMPQATIDALVLRQQQELLRNQQRMEQLAATASLKPQTGRAASLDQSTGNNAAVASQPSSSGQMQTAPDLERSAKSAGLAVSNAATDEKASIDKQVVGSSHKAASSNDNEPASLESAMHMHDDDPHDDDEMFLDEDEAIELAHLQSSVSSIEFNHNNATSIGKVNVNSSEHSPVSYTQQASASAAHNQSLPQQQPRTLSKAASERKLKKYRKLMAQTQVPKPSALTAENEQQDRRDPLAASSFQQQQSARARRHAHQASREDAASRPHQVQVSHHIVYRQKPSSEGSSSDHQHSFMISPGQYSSSMASMEQMALNFSPQRLSKRSADRATDSANEQFDENDADENDNDDDNMIDGHRHHHQINGAERLARLGSATSGKLDGGTDYAHDPLGGQFYLEPGTMTGVERAGYSDWSLLSSSSLASGRRSRLAPPPYALNASDESAYYSQQSDSFDGLNNNNNNNYNYNNNNNNNSSGANPHRSHNLTAQETTRRRFKRQTRLAPGQVRRKRQAPDTVWPEVLLVVDYDSFLLHGGDSRDVKRYFVSFWNGVDLRYKLLVHPHIRISLAGMIVAKDRDATPYLERNRLRAPNADAVDAAGALTDMGKYLYREDRLPTYDLAVVITKLDMCRRRYEGGRCNRGTAGFAYVGGACVVNKRLEKVNSVAIIEDSGGFSGIIVAAHEVGHLLGCVHDGSPPPSYLGGPGATHCPWEDGFIMSDLRHTERGFRWSQCSVEQFKHFLNGETATCLYNYPHESQMLHRLLPGTMLTLDEQCKRDRGTNACFKDARVCAQLFCFDSASGYCVSYRPAAEGSPCGEAQVCRNGKCVGEIENIIPDYTHQTQTVVARRPHSVTSRIADNGLSASSTSTATSSPDSRFSPATGNAVNPTNQLISRMDTFPIDTPLNGPSIVSYPVTGSTNNRIEGRHSSGSVSIDGGSPVNSGLMLMRQQAGISTTVPASGSPMHYTTFKSGKLVADSHHISNKQQSGYQQRNGHQAIPKGANQGVVKLYHNQHRQQNNNHHPQSSTGLYTSASTMSHQYPPSSPGGNNLLTSVSTNPVTPSKRQQQQQQLFDNQRIMYQQPIIKHSESHSDINNNQPQQQHLVNRNHVNVNHPVYQNRHSTSTSSSRLYNPLSQTTTVTF